jgi:aspartokinase/homoserine dehydrogenase 1
MLVVKFGGTSVGTKGAISHLLSILKDGEHAGRTIVVVVSALSGITDELIGAASAALEGGAPLGSSLTGEMKRRHFELSEAFLDREEKEDADAEIEATFSELDRMLDGIGILRELSPRILDGIMSFGERLSAPLVASILRSWGIHAAYLDSRELILTDDNFGRARVLPEETFRRIRERVQGGDNDDTEELDVFVASGFIGSTEDDSVTTLGRGGSDLTAALYGAALGAEKIEIWTDVNGIMTADPRMVKNAFRIDSISYEEAMELSHFGAKVLYPPTVKPALEKGIPIVIRNTFNPSCPGTAIVMKAASSPYPIRGISSLSSVTLLRVQGSGMVGVTGFSSRLFGALARQQVNVILISQASSEYSICCAVDPGSGASALAAIREEFGAEIAGGALDDPVAEKDLAVVAVVGERMKRVSGISGKVFHALGRNGINVVAIAQGSSELNISLVINRQDEAKAINAIHEAFFLSGVRSVNLFLLGTGLIGGTLLDQLGDHQEVLADEYKIRITLAGAANSREMLFDSAGLDPLAVKKALGRGENSGGADAAANTAPFNLDGFLSKMKDYNLPNTAFCDCTASEQVASRYAELLASSIPVVTPNKRANGGDCAYYKTLTDYSREWGIPYLYETTVCAGLPVISTLRDLFLSGDRVRRIEAVLSGTLSFIFNNFDGTRPFSALLREAKQAGYTEPDPRDDLNAMDAARKALILARECGMPLEFDSVHIEPLLPPVCFEAPDVEAFFAELEKSDADFASRHKTAAAEGNALRYVAVIEAASGGSAAGSVRLLLREEGEDSPFRTLKDSDNMVVIYSDRYSRLPMVIKGPGAGAQVTAGGVFADIVRIARTLV